MSGNHVTARVFVGNEIRRAREAKVPRMSRAKLAEALIVSESLVAKWETGRLVPLPDYVDRLCEILDLPDMIVRVIADLVSNEIAPEWFGKWPEFERKAASIWSFEPSLIPGLLQTEDYAREILRAANLGSDLEETLRTRIERQQILTKDDPPMLVFLVAECVLRHNVGGAKVMHGQLAHLAECAERENIIVQVIPDCSEACAGFLSGFVIASFDGTDIAYVDNQLDGDTIENAVGIARLRRFFDVFRGDALSRAESIDLIQRMAVQWMSR
jgi:transcriptional regulator with XRE-family HTH domain